MNSKLIYALALILCGCGNANRDDKTIHTSESSLAAIPYKCDLGTLEKKKGNNHVPFSFLIRSNVDSIIHITKVDVSCKCLAVDSINAVFPNQDNVLKGTIDVSHLSGHVNKALYVNCGNGGVLLLRVVGEVME